MIKAMKRHGQGLAVGIVSAMLAVSANAQTPPTQDGTVTLEGVTVPLSDLLSPEAREYMRHLIVDKPFGAPAQGIVAERARQDDIMRSFFLNSMLERYKVNITERTIGGVLTQVVTPAAGIKPADRNRVLLNVHGGGFTTGGKTASLVESVPLAALLGVTVISIDYRMSPEFKYPAGTEDVAAVYKEVLKTHKPSQVGLYGCSAGGILASQAVAWFQSHDLPRPGAIGIFCSGIGAYFNGDAARVTGGLNGQVRRRPSAGAEAPVAPPPPSRPMPIGGAYMAGVSDTDPEAYPLASEAVLAKFPPTLFITATRSFEFSAAVNSHNKLSKTGVDTELFVWDALAHAFIYNSDLPESREAYGAMTRFFDKHLAK